MCKQISKILKQGYNSVPYLLYRNYIEHGLKSIEAETKNDGGHRGVLAESAVENNQGTNSGDSNQAPHLYYLVRLKKLGAQAGLDKGSVVASSTTSGIGSSNSNATSHYRISATSSTSAESYSSRSNYTVTASEADTESTSSTLTASLRINNLVEILAFQQPHRPRLNPIVQEAITLSQPVRPIRNQHPQL